MAHRDDLRLNVALVYGEFHPPLPKPQTNVRMPSRLDILHRVYEWIKESPHDAHCLLNFPEKDAWRCICGKNHLLDALEAQLHTSAEPAFRAMQGERDAA